MADEFGLNKGDIMVFRNWIIIYAGWKESEWRGNIKHAVMFYAIMNLERETLDICSDGPRPGIGYFEDNQNPRYATNAEVNRFFDKIKRLHQAKWDYENRKFITYSENPEKYEQLY